MLADRASSFGRSIGACPYTILAIQRGVVPQCLSSRASEAILVGVIGERAGLKRGTAALGITLHRLPTVLPRSIKVHSAIGCCLYRRVIGIVTIGHHLLRALS